MKLFNNTGHSKLIINAGLFIVVALIITLFYPFKGDFKYEFTKGKPWLHNDLVAPFDFSIHKSAQQVEQEVDSLRKSVNSFFRLDTSITSYTYNETKEILSKIDNDTLVLWKKNVLKEVEEIYKKGVYDKYLSDVNKSYITLIRGKFIEEIKVEEIKSKADILNDLEIKFGDNIQIIEDLIIPNILYDELVTQKAINNVSHEISETYGYIKKGEKIIYKGEIVSANLFITLSSLREEFEQQSFKQTSVILILTGRFVLVLLLLWFLYLFIITYRKELFVNTKNILFLLLLMLLFVASARFVIGLDKLSVYIIPFAIIPVIVRTFFDGRLGLFVSILTVLIIAGMVPNSYEFVFIQIAASMTAIFTLQNINERGKLFTTAAFVVATYSVIYFASSFIQVGNLTSINNNNFIWFVGSGLLLLSSYPLIYIFERMFGFLSDVTLMELADTNQPLLRNLAESSPGTFQHSMQVANIAEEITRKLNGNPLLARTGALYHDIGKSLNPQYFIENQNQRVNPHDSIEFDKSAEIIISHVSEGVKLAKQYNLPTQIIDFIKMHHGVTKVQYFYRSFIKKYPNIVPDESKFTYPGPRPNTKETAIVMVSDSVEAATRSLKIVTEEAIAELVDGIIDSIINDGQFMYTNLTFNDITVIRRLLKDKMNSIYHGRIEYPE